MFIDRMKTGDSPPEVALNCASCGEKVPSGEQHQCKEEKKDESEN